MSFNKILQVLLKVLTDPRLIVICIVVILYLNFMIFVANYRRKFRPKTQKKAIVLSSESKKKKEASSEDEGDEGDEEEKDEEA